MSLSQTSKPRGALSDLYPRPFGARYTLLKELGQGGMGQIFMALTGQEGAERVCALKVIRQLESPGREPHELGKRFLDEAKVVTKLSHENLVYVFDFGVVGEQGYLAMEYLRGKTLAELWNRCAVRKVGFPLGVTLHLVSEIAAGLAYAHGLERFDLVHRDISPSNVMLSYTGGVKLIDFGLAKWRSKLAQTISGINWGKVSYMSPEQHTGRPIDHRSDIFSLGLILWELLTGRQLYPNEQVRAAAGAVPPPSQFNGAVEEGLDRVVLKALASDPAERFQSAAGFGQSLARFAPKDASKLGLSHFLTQLFDADAKSEAAEEEAMVARAVATIKARPSDTYLAAVPENMTPADPMIGLVLAERYYVKRLIGEGAMGRVYEGHHTGIGKRVAIKVPRHAERRKSELIERFKLEANAASQIGHANIADVTDCGTTPGGDFFFVMEYVDGVDLSKLIRRDGQLSIERCLVISIQICRALEAAHRAGIIHRDLKPGNVMLVREREGNELVKVLDFGVAKFLRSTTSDELTKTDAAVGTPRYMAPEQVDSGKNVDFRVDIYALGGLLYNMLTGGESPDPGESVQEVWQRKLHDPAVPITQWRNDLPPELEKLIMRALERRPDDRPQSMTELRQALVKILERVRANGSSVMAMKAPNAASHVTASATARMPRVVLGRQKLWLLFTGVALLGGGAYFVLREPHPRDQIETRAPTPAVAAPVTHAPQRAAPLPPPADPAPVPTVVPTAPIVQEAAAPPPRKETAAPAQHATKTAEKHKPDLSPVAPAGPPAFESTLQLAEQEFRADHLFQAQLLAEKAVEQGAKARGYVLLGKAFFFDDEYAKAASAYREALKLEPNNAAANAGLVRAEEKLRR
ncbi:MAG: protein kinase [Deltaproteobacteria bacterium]|nr:protein kinase [Deltaproteobacteria bacterium]